MIELNKDELEILLNAVDILQGALLREYDRLPVSTFSPEEPVREIIITEAQEPSAEEPLVHQEPQSMATAADKPLSVEQDPFAPSSDRPQSSYSPAPDNIYSNHPIIQNYFNDLDIEPQDAELRHEDI